jgi:hypothetical protein
MLVGMDLHKQYLQIALMKKYGRFVVVIVIVVYDIV